MDRERFHARARKGVNPIVYWLSRAVMQPFFHLYFRLSRIGREHVPTEGPVIFASNHRSFLDPFIIGTLARRPLYFVAKQELFTHKVAAWYLNSLGAFPVDRGSGDQDAMSTAREILQRGECVVIFPEGTRIRPGGLSSPRRGVGRLALETGAPVVPVSLIGTEDVRKKFRIRPRKVRIRAGKPLTFPKVEQPSPQLAANVTERIWPCVELQWEWLGGVAPLRRAAIVGAGSWGTSLAVSLARAGMEVQLGCRSAEQVAALLTEGSNERYLPGVELPAGVEPMRAADLSLDEADLVCFAVPSSGLPAAVAAHGERVPERAAVLVLSKGLVAPHGMVPSAYVAERVPARAVACLGGPGHAADALRNGAALVVGSADRVLTAQLCDVLGRAGHAATGTDDITGVELAGTAKNAAALAAAAAGVVGVNAAGAAAGRVFAEIDAYARARGGRPETFAGLAGAGDLVATVLAAQSRNRRAGELLGQGMSADRIASNLGQTSEALEGVTLLAETLRREGISAPTLDGLSDLVEGRIEPEGFHDVVTIAGRSRTRAVA